MLERKVKGVHFPLNSCGFLPPTQFNPELIGLGIGRCRSFGRYSCIDELLCAGDLNRHSLSSVEQILMMRFWGGVSVRIARKNRNGFESSAFRNAANVTPAELPGRIKHDLVVSPKALKKSSCVFQLWRYL